MSDIVRDLEQEGTAAGALVLSLRAIFGDDEDLLATAVEGETSLYEAIDRCLHRLAELNAHMAALKALQETMKARSERFDNQAQMLRAAILVAMQASGQRKIELPIATLSEAKVAPSVDIFDEKEIPPNYWRRPDPVVDKKTILQALKDGTAIAGARLADERTTLKINYK